MTTKEIDWDTFTFGVGKHESPDEGMCVMEAVAYIQGEPFSDHPQCVCPVIASFLRSWNDRIKDDARRSELMRPFLCAVAGTKADEATELRRSWMAFDWLVRELLPSFLELSETLATHAADLRSLPELHADNFDLAVPIVNAAWAAASAAARAAESAAASAAAMAAAMAAARDAAWAAARDAARDAASAAARDAALAAALDAASDALTPTVDRLQQSATDLVNRMIAVESRQ